MKKEEEDIDPIDAFFSGKIVRTVKKVNPSFSIVQKVVKQENQEIKRNVLESENETIRSEQERRLLTQFLNTPVEEINCTLGIVDVKEEAEQFLPELDIYNRYQFDIRKQDLPIASKHREIIQAIRENRVVILKASTGSGKSSQGKIK